MLQKTFPTKKNIDANLWLVQEVHLNPWQPYVYRLYGFVGNTDLTAFLANAGSEPLDVKHYSFPQEDITNTVFNEETQQDETVIVQHRDPLRDPANATTIATLAGQGKSLAEIAISLVEDYLIANMVEWVGAIKV